MKKYFKFLFVVSLFFVVKSVFAYDVSILKNIESVSTGSEFYVDLILNTDGNSINGIEGSVIFDTKKAKFIRSETGQSFITNWIESPYLLDNTIVFSGIVPNGFTNFTDLATGQKTKSKIARLVFLATSDGDFLLNTKNITVAANDGEGSITKINDTQENIKITNTGEIKSYSFEDVIKPTIIVEIVKDANLFEGRDTLIFNAIDKESGIEGVYLKNKKGEWIKINSPYLLEESVRKGIITLRAVDFSGNYKSISIFPNIKNTILHTNVLYVILIIGLIIFFYIKRNAKKKN